jgi:hypothetical protein
MFKILALSRSRTLTKFFLSKINEDLKMIKEIKTLYNQILKPLNLAISHMNPDLECEEYVGHNFKINEANIKFRKSKLTPKKIGQFVTLWKRTPDGKTIPFDIDDNFDFYIIHVEENDNAGFFIFPKITLENHKILASNVKEGKRGFRVYADWHFPENKQAGKTKQWQTEFFINHFDTENKMMEKLKQILN